MIESFLQSSISLFKLYSEWLSFSHFSVFVYGQVENSETSESSESSEFCFRRSLFRLFDFDLTPKIENSEKNSELSELPELSEFPSLIFATFENF